MVLIGLGSNQGDSVGIIKEAMLRLTVFAEGELKESSLWVTSPVDCPADSPDFINAVVGLSPKKNLTEFCHPLLKPICKTVSLWCATTSFCDKREPCQCRPFRAIPYYHLN